MPGGWVQPRVIGHWYTSLSAITNHKCHWLNIIYIYSQLYVYIYIQLWFIIYYIHVQRFMVQLVKTWPIHIDSVDPLLSHTLGRSQLLRETAAISSEGFPISHSLVSRGMQGNITLKYWGYNLQQILVLVMWTKSPKFGTFTKPWSWTVAQKVRTSAHLRYLSSRFWPTVSPATTLKADTDVGGFNPH
jgi:hypothetical protein